MQGMEILPTHVLTGIVLGTDFTEVENMLMVIRNLA